MKYIPQPIRIPQNTLVPIVIPLHAYVGDAPTITVDIDRGGGIEERAPNIVARKITKDGVITALEFNPDTNGQGRSLDSLIIRIKP